MNTPEDVVAFYLRRIENAAHPVEKRIIEDDLLLYYYRLTEDECEVVRPLLQAVLDKKRRVLEVNDPMLKRAGELLERLKNQTATV